MASQRYTVSQVARMARITVRALHHYDEQGLLVPSLRSRAGYRLYTAADLKRLQRILVLRELGFSLDAIGDLLVQGVSALHEALLGQRTRVLQQLEESQAVLQAIDVALDVTEREESSMAEMFEGVDQFESIRCEREVRDRWGETSAYRESSRRIKGYGKEDWQRMKEEANTLLADWRALLERGSAPNSDEATAVAERARLYIDRWFYPCSHAQHSVVSALYVEDARFRAYYDAHASGLADYVAACIVANERRAAAAAR